MRIELSKPSKDKNDKTKFTFYLNNIPTEKKNVVPKPFVNLPNNSRDFSNNNKETVKKVHSSIESRTKKTKSLNLLNLLKGLIGKFLLKFLEFIKILLSKKTFFYLFIFLFIVFAVLIFYFEQQKSSQNNFIKNEYVEQFLKIISSSKSYDIRKITDINLIRQNNPESAAFYQEAQNGDVIIILVDAELAAIIRPSENKIVNIAKIQLKQ